MERIIMHIDVNNAFLSWSAVYYLQHGSRVDIRNTCAIIAGDKKKRAGIVLAKSIPAKKMGIKSAEPIFMAQRKCNKLSIYPPNFKFYSEMSHKMFDYLYTLSPDIEIASIDECYLDYSKVKKLYGDELVFAHKIKDYIKFNFGFTVNIGIGNNKLTAKMASDFEKPDKVHTLYDEEVVDKMYPLSIDDLFGIGKQTSIKLKELGITTISDLANFDLNILKKIFKNMAQVMYDSARGINNEPINSDIYINKGISNEITLIEDTTNDEEIYNNLLYLSELVGYRIRKINKYATTVTIILKNNKFIRKSHQKKLINSINSDEEIYSVVKDLYKSTNYNEPIRLIGIRLDNLVDNKVHQSSLFDTEKVVTSSKLDKTIDNLKEKYGNKIIRRASLIGKEEIKGLKKDH